ncbi:MAG: hypothetical protein ACO27R_03960 [Hylemonella sp.]
MTAHKRIAQHRDTSFRKPLFNCYACHDTGLLSNSDGLLREYLPDYDFTPDGQPMGGHDLGLVCWCHSAYKELGPDGQVIRGGFREDSGELRKVQTSNGQQAIGASLPKEIVRELHQRRRQQWQATEAAMSEARASGQVPSWMAEVKELLKASGKSSSGLQSLGSLLGQSANSLDP